MAAAVTTAESRAATILRGRREGALLALPSVQRVADVLAARCRERSWVRTSVASLERFRVLAAGDDLEALLARARAEPAEAERALGSFAAALGRMPNAGRMQYAPTEGQVAALAMGPKIWFRLNGVAIPWRPLPGRKAEDGRREAEEPRRLLPSSGFRRPPCSRGAAARVSLRRSRGTRSWAPWPGRRPGSR